MSPDIHWHVGEDAEQETIAQTTSPRRSRRSWIVVLIVVILGASLGMAYRSIPEPAPRPTPIPSPIIDPTPTPTPSGLPAKLFAAIDREAQALADGDLDSYIALQVPQDEQTAYSPSLRPCIQCDDVLLAWGRPSDDHPLYTIIDFNLRTQTQAWANIRQFRDGRWFRQTRFYQFNPQEARWLRSDPDPFFWSGQVETLDTPHFHIIYALEDRELVRPLANPLEEVYPQVCRNLDCVQAAAGFTYTVKLNGTSAEWGFLSGDGREIDFSSPRLSGVFEDNLLASANALQHFITVAAIQRAYYGAATQWNGDAVGHIVFNPIIDWARQQRTAEPNDPPATAAYLKTQKLVPLKDLWGQAYVFDQQQTTVPRPDADVIYPEGDLVIHFIVQKYGAQAIPKLLKALGTAQSFADVIERGLGVPFEEFDQKWQAWAKQNIVTH